MGTLPVPTASIFDERHHVQDIAARLGMGLPVPPRLVDHRQRALPRAALGVDLGGDDLERRLPQVRVGIERPGQQKRRGVAPVLIDVHDRDLGQLRIAPLQQRGGEGGPLVEGVDVPVVVLPAAVARAALRVTVGVGVLGAQRPRELRPLRRPDPLVERVPRRGPLVGHREATLERLDRARREILGWIRRRCGRGGGRLGGAAAHESQASGDGQGAHCEGKRARGLPGAADSRSLTCKPLCP